MAALSPKEMAKLRNDLDDQYGLGFRAKLVKFVITLGPKIDRHEAPCRLIKWRRGVSQEGC